MKKNLFFLVLLMTPFYAMGLEPFVVGTASGYAPYVSLDTQGKYEGFDIDVAEALAQKLNRELVIKDFGSMPSLMLALQQGKADALIWAISITDERQKKMEMIYYQGDKVVEMPLLFWKNIPKEVKTLEDIKGAICVEAGSYQEGIVKKIPNLNLKYTDKITDAILEIKYGKSSATLIDPSLVTRFTARYPEIKVLNVPLPPEEQSLGNGICINKTNQKLAAEIRQAIAELTAEGKIVELEKKWMEQ